MYNIVQNVIINDIKIIITIKKIIIINLLKLRKIIRTDKLNFNFSLFA